jgi:hypothetical protein
MFVWFGLIFWSALTLSGWFILPAIGMFFTAIFAGDDALRIICSRNSEPQAAGLLILGLAAIMLGAVRLVRLDRELPKSYQRAPMPWTGPMRMSGNEDLGSHHWTERLQNYMIAIRTRHVQRAAVSSWSRILRWQVGTPAGWAIAPNAVILFLTFVVLYFAFSLFLNHAGRMQRAPDMLPMVAFVLNFCPAITTGMLSQKQMLWFEILLPEKRNSFLKQKGLAIAVDMFQMWGSIGLAAILWQRITLPQSTFLLMALLAHSFLWQIGIFGVGIWALRLRSTLWAAALVMVFMQLPINLCNSAIMAPSALWQHVSWYLSGGFAVFGLLMTWYAYRRWLVADID